MKRMRFISFLLALVLVLPILSVCSLAEESSVTPLTENYTVNIVFDGESRKTFNCYFNGSAVDESHEGSGALVISVEPAEGYKIVAAYFGTDEPQSLTQSGDNFQGEFSPAAGAVYTLRVVTEATTAVKNTLNVNSNVGYVVIGNDGLQIDDLSVATFAEGDNVTVKFDVGGEFDASKASLSVNGASVDPVLEYSFKIASGENMVVFNYDLSSDPTPATLTVDAGSYAYSLLVNGAESSVIYAGDTVKITFVVNGFDPSKATLLYNNSKIDMTEPSYTFTAVDNNRIVFKYGEATPANLAVSGNGKNLQSIGYTVSVNGAQVDPATYEYKIGDSVTVKFDVNVENPADAFCKVNGNDVSLSGNSATFILDSENNNVIFGYGVVPVNFVLNGPGYYSINKNGSLVTEVRNNSASAKGGKTLYLNKDEQYTFTVNPALNYELSGLVEVSEPRRDMLNDVYYFTPGGETNVSASFKAASVTVPTFSVKINVHMGGNITVGTQVIYGGTGGQIDLAEGQGTIIGVAADEGYELDRFLVNGTETELENDSYTISGISADITVDVYFKSDAEIDISNAIGVGDVSWTADVITIDVRGSRPVKREVLAKIATLDRNTGKFVEFIGDAGTIYVPYGGNFVGTSEVMMINVTEMRNGDLYANISNAVLSQDGVGTVFKSFAIGITENMPLGSMISFNLGNGFSNGYAELRTYDGSSFKTVADAQSVSPAGASSKYSYDNQPALICVKQKPVAEDLSDTPITESKPDESRPVSDTDDGTGANSVIVIIIIALVAVAGAAALFIVKWRQEKF